MSRDNHSKYLQFVKYLLYFSLQRNFFTRHKNSLRSPQWRLTYSFNWWTSVIKPGRFCENRRTFPLTCLTGKPLGMHFLISSYGFPIPDIVQKSPCVVSCRANNTQVYPVFTYCQFPHWIGCFGTLYCLKVFATSSNFKCIIQIEYHFCSNVLCFEHSLCMGVCIGASFAISL